MIYQTFLLRERESGGELGQLCLRELVLIAEAAIESVGPVEGYFW